MGGGSDLIRRLTSEDARLLRQADAWDADAPDWYRSMSRVFNSGPVEELIAQLDDYHKCFVGIWDESEFVAVVIIDWKERGQFEGHLMARRDANTTLIARAIEHLLHDLLDFGLHEAYVWVAEKNAGVRRLCESAGMLADGIVMYRGVFHVKRLDGTVSAQPIKWLRYSVERKDLLIAKAA